MHDVTTWKHFLHRIFFAEGVSNWTSRFASQGDSAAVFQRLYCCQPKQAVEETVVLSVA